MRYLLFVLVFFVSCQQNDSKSLVENASSIKLEEDCDSKAEKKVEITEDSIKLNNTDAGCSLEDVADETFDQK